MVDVLKSPVADLAGGVDFDKLQLAPDKVQAPAMPKSDEGLADKVARAILKANPVAAEPPVQAPITRQCLETYYAYGTKAQCGFEISLVRVREVDSSVAYSPVLRVFPKYKLRMKLSRRGEKEVMILHDRIPRSFRYEEVPMADFSVEKNMKVWKYALMWTEVTRDHKALKGRDPMAWERLFQKLFSSFSELSSKKKES